MLDTTRAKLESDRRLSLQRATRSDLFVGRLTELNPIALTSPYFAFIADWNQSLPSVAVNYALLSH